MTDQTANIYQIHIRLKNSDPAIWRRVLIAGDSSLMRLHCVIQQSMGWDDAHAHLFQIGEDRYSAPIPFNPDHLKELNARNTKTTRLSELFIEEQATASYIYDFGDQWEHTILVEAILSPDTEYSRPICTDGNRACPPEDVGGLAGYAIFLGAINNPDHKNYEDYVAWIGASRFDAEAFDIDAANERLKMLC
ncbi:MAG: plasmid pRiA4b ORF-3 family protein [Aggregatilineales bacterium]